MSKRKKPVALSRSRRRDAEHDISIRPLALPLVAERTVTVVVDTSYIGGDIPVQLYRVPVPVTYADLAERFAKSSGAHYDYVCVFRIC